MNKLIAAITTALLMSVGLVGFSGSQAQAQGCPYTGCLNTRTHLNGPAAINRHKRAKFTVVVRSGNAQPRGRIQFIVSRDKGGFNYVRVYRYQGHKRKMVTPRLHQKGKYTVTAIYRPQGQPFNRSSDSDKLRVRRR